MTNTTPDIPTGERSETPTITGRFHIISITHRRAVGDRAYHVRDSFDANLEEACGRHSAFSRPGVRCSVLRDGLTGARYSLESSIAIDKAAAFEAEHLANLRSIAEGFARSAAQREQ